MMIQWRENPRRTLPQCNLSKLNRVVYVGIKRVVYIKLRKLCYWYFIPFQVHCYLKSWAVRHRFSSRRGDSYRKNSMTATQYSIVAPATRRTIRPVEHPPSYIAMGPVDIEGDGLYNISNGHHCSWYKTTPTSNTAFVHIVILTLNNCLYLTWHSWHHCC